MSKLPSIYKEKINIKDNNKKYCYVTNKESIKEEIKELSKSFYKSKFYIKTKNKELETYIYEYKDDYLRTIKNEKISLDDIISIKRIS